MTKFFNFIGLEVSKDGIVSPSRLFGKLICRMAERDGKFIKMGKNAWRIKK